MNLLLLLLSTSAFAAISGPLFTQSEKTIIDSLRCQKQVKEVLKDWRFTGEWSKHLSQEGNDGVVLNSPTRNFATWVSLKVHKEEVTMDLIRPLAAKKISFNSSCQQETQLLTPKPAYSLKDRFTDEALKKFIDKNQNGLIYVWSTGMPWSVEGIKHIRDAAKELKLPVKVVMSPLSDMKTVKSLLAEKKITKEDTEMHASLEFVMRGMAIHDPSVLSFKNRQLSRWARPGREGKEMYLKYYAKEFK